MSLTEISAVTKSNVNPDVEISSETSFSQNTHKEGMSRGARHTNLDSDTEAENTAKRKTSEHLSGFSATDVARQKPSGKPRLEADSENEVSEKEDDEYSDFKRFRVVPKHDEFKWDLPENLTQMIVSTNLSLKKIYRKIF